jgi:hypothetical protein
MITAGRSFLWLVIVAVLIRAGVSWFGFSDLMADPDAYARLAANLATTGTYGFEGDGGVAPTAFRPPFYPWLLSWLVHGEQVSRVAVAVLHIVLGGGTVALTLGIGRRLHLQYAWLAGLAVAIDPLLLRQSQLVMTETLAVFLAVLAWWLWLYARLDLAQATRGVTRRRGTEWLAVVGLGLVLGISVLSRPTAAPWALLCGLAVAAMGDGCWRRRLRDCVLICVGVVVCVAPWTLRNWALLGKPIWATTHGGYTLLLANNPPLYRHFAERGPSRAWDAEEFHEAWNARLSLENRPAVAKDAWRLGAESKTPTYPSQPKLTFNEVADDQLAYAAALSTIARQPRMFALSCIYRVGWLWALWPHDGSVGRSEILIAVWYAVGYCAALAGLWRIVSTREFSGWLVGLILVLSLTAVHAVYWSNMRMRAPAMPCVILLAASAFQGLPRRMAINPSTIKTPPAI